MVLSCKSRWKPFALRSRNFLVECAMTKKPSRDATVSIDGARMTVREVRDIVNALGQALALAEKGYMPGPVLMEEWRQMLKIEEKIDGSR